MAGTPMTRTRLDTLEARIDTVAVALRNLRARVDELTKRVPQTKTEEGSQ